MRFLYFVIVFFFLTLELFAQPGPPPPDPDKPVPIQGLGFLLAAGVALGIKKLRDNQKHK